MIEERGKLQHMDYKGEIMGLKWRKRIEIGLVGGWQRGEKNSTACNQYRAKPLEKNYFSVWPVAKTQLMHL